MNRVGITLSISMIVSLIFGFAMIIAGFIVEGGNLMGILKPTAAMIVLGGVTGAIGISFPVEELKRIPKILGVAFRNKSRDINALIELFKNIAIKTRKNGLLSLEEDLSHIDDAFMKKGLQMVVDGVEPQSVRNILEAQAVNISERHRVGISIFEQAGGFAPTMGIIGTVLALVNVLGKLSSDPGNLGPEVATAFVATLYGIGTANLIFLPIANKLKALNRKENKELELIIEGILSLQEGVNPSTLVEKLQSYTDSNNVPSKSEPDEV